MSAQKRIILAFVSMLLAVTCIGFMGVVPLAFHYGLKKAIPIFEMLPVYIMFALPGMALAAPFVLLFKDAIGPRLWWTLAIGTAIGPSFILTWVLLSLHGRFNWQANGVAIVLSTEIGTLTTFFYVLLLRHFIGASLQRQIPLDQRS
jgi:hypothetical protein